MNSNLPILILSLMICCHAGFNSCLVAQSDSITVGPKSDSDVSEADLKEANLDYRRAKENYQTQLRLAKRGSVSKLELKRARLEKDVAGLTLNSLRDPSKTASNRVEIARLNYDFEKQDLAAAKRLLKIGSISQLRFRRKTFKFKLAEIRLKAATGEISSESGKLLIAKRQVELAESELELGKKLFKNRSITQSTLQNLKSNLTETQRKLNELQELQRKKQESIQQKIRT